MAKRTAQFVSALFAGVIAGAPLAMSSPDAARAANSCLTEPKDGAPEGKHWYYRIDHSSKRHCWYLRDQGASRPTAESAPSDGEEAATERSPQQRSVDNARAELPMPQGRLRPDNGLPVVRPPLAAAPGFPATTAATGPGLTEPAAQGASQGSSQGTLQGSSQGSSQGSLIASRWPDSSGTAPATAAAPAPSFAVADAGTDPAPAAATPMQSADAAPPVTAVAEKPETSLQTLAMVIFGALALAGLTASVVYRLGRRRPKPKPEARLRRGVNWPTPERSADRLSRDRRGAEWPPLEDTLRPPPPWAKQVANDDTAPGKEMPRTSPAAASDLDRIEHFLAQLARQGQD
jgi:hypothetical protein